MKTLKFLSLLAVLMVLASSCQTQISPAPPATTPHPCASEEAQAFLNEMDEIATTFQDLVVQAEDASPEDIETLTKEMEEISERIHAMDAPPCALETKAALENYFLSARQCRMSIFAKSMGMERMDDTDWCILAEQQYEYYQEKIGELRLSVGDDYR